VLRDNKERIEKEIAIIVNVCLIPLIWNATNPTKNHPIPHNKSSDIISNHLFSLFHNMLLPLRLYLHPALTIDADPQNLQVGVFMLVTSIGCEVPHLFPDLKPPSALA
jgi:hypothetical protein